MMKKYKDNPYLKKSKRESDNQKTAQEFINVKDIRDVFLYTMDDYIISFIKVQAISIDLLSDSEKRILTRKLTDEFSEEDSPFTFLAVSRPVDISPLINEYINIMHYTDDQIQKELLRNEIRVISEFSLSGEVVQREFFYKIWEKNTEGAEAVLRKRAADIVNRLDSAGLKSEIMKQHNIVRLCNLVNNPAFAAIEDTSIDVMIPFLNNYESEEVA
jgi:hypothetical protein